MGLWDGLPYELQSPRWRNAMNKKAGGGGTWDPSLNQDFATKFIDAQVNLERARASREGVNTSQIDGQTPFVENLTNFGTALLQSIGVRPDAPQPQPSVVHPAAFGRSNNAGIDTRTVMMVGGVALGVYLIWGR